MQIVVNTVISNWHIDSSLGADWYSVTCTKCGLQRKIRGYYLKRKPPECTECKKEKDIIGKTFGKLTVVEKLDKGFVKCRCECGNIKVVHRRYLQDGTTTSCGCDKIGYTSKLVDITNQTFGKWFVEYYYKDKLWLCKCKNCGREKLIRGHLLRGGNLPDCVCDTQNRIANENLEKYGVRSLKQLNSRRTLEQIRMYDTKEAFINTISKTPKFDNKPTIREIAEYIKIDSPSVLSYVRKYGLEDLVQIGIYRSHFETDIATMFPCNNIGNRTVLHGKEIDLYYPEHNLGIEFNGNYWHSTLQKPIKYHQEKSILAAKNGIRLIHIFEYEWVNKDRQDKIIDILNMIINKDNVERISARECEIKLVDTNSTKEFLNKNHLQNYTTSKINIGLFHNNVLVGIMTFGTPRFNTEYEWELTRLAWKTNTIIVGGAEKLFKYFLNNYNPNSIISYCDISKFTGNVYKRLGFKVQGITNPNYVWSTINSDIVLKRYDTMDKEMISKRFNIETNRDESGKIIDTENDIMAAAGFLKIYDAGNLVFVWNKPTEEK